LSVAVVLNQPLVSLRTDIVNEASAAAGGDVKLQEQIGEYSTEEIGRFTELVKGAIGFNAERGDVVTIIATKFEEPKLSPEEKVLWYENSQVLGLIKTTIFAMVLIAVLFFVVRPMLKSYASPITAIRSPAKRVEESKDGELSIDDLSLFNSGGAESMKNLQKKLKPKKSNIPIEMLDTANTYDDKVSLVRLLVADDAKRVANVLKSMIGTA
jgi:flagellar M-ring protein FliF